MKDQVNLSLINEYIKENGLTKKEFCKRCRIGMGTFYRIMRGEEDYNIKSLFKIAKAMDLRICQLFENDPYNKIKRK